MISASVTIRPLNPSSRRSAPRITGERAAGTPDGSTAGKATCAVMMDATLAAMAASNGTASVLASVSADAVTTGSPACESVVVRP